MSTTVERPIAQPTRRTGRGRGGVSSAGRRTGPPGEGEAAAPTRAEPDRERSASGGGNGAAGTRTSTSRAGATRSGSGTTTRRPAGTATRPATRPGTRPAARPATRPDTGAAARPRRRVATADGAAPRMPFVLLVVGLLGGALVSLLLLNTVLAKDAFTLTELQRGNKQLAERQQALEEEIARADSPETLARRARELGMVPATTPRFVRVDGGQGSPTGGSPRGALGTAGAAGVVGLPPGAVGVAGAPATERETAAAKASARPSAPGAPAGGQTGGRTGRQPVADQSAFGGEGGGR
jgi:cell division protein FtsB